ncbi:MAG: hypothetical protein QW512_05325 [Thermofilaceae archaeon]
MIKQTFIYEILRIIEKSVLKAKADNSFNTAELLLDSNVKFSGHVSNVSTVTFGNKVGIIFEIDTFDPNVEYDFNMVRIYGYNFDSDLIQLGSDKVLIVDSKLNRTYKKPLNKGGYIKITYWFGDFV